MKTKLKLLTTALCGLFLTPAVFGQFSQATWIWTNNSPSDISFATNWINAATGANGVPSSVTGDIMEFNGQSSGPVIATANYGVSTQSGSGPGLNLWITGNQTSPVTLCTTVANTGSPFSRFNTINIDSGAGQFSLGNGNTTNALQLVWGNGSPQWHGFTNNSANPAIICPDVGWRMGGGGMHTFQFFGAGNWYVTNDISSHGGGTIVEVDGPGTLVWTAGHNIYSQGNNYPPGSPLNINGGSVILKSPGLFASTVGSVINNNGTLLEWDLGAQSQSYPGTITGTGMLQVNSGTLTLGAGSSGGQNTFTGNVVLSGGELIVNSTENLGVSGPLGNGGMISFIGGTLGFSSVNTYDYSPRFTNSASQAYSFDTAGQYVTFTNALTSSGGTLAKLGSGTLTLTGANAYSGLTTVSAGKLEIQGSQGSGSITVSNNATLGVTGTGPQITPATLTVGTTASAILEFNNVSSTTTAPLAVAGTVSAGGAIQVNVVSGSFLIGQHYPLLTFSGTPPAVTLGTLVGAVGNLSTNGNVIELNVTGLAYVWTGNQDTNWDTSAVNNWNVSGVPQIWTNGSAAFFDDTIATGNTNINLNSPVSPASVTVISSTKPYSITSSGTNLIAGSGSLTKNGNSTLTLSGGINTYSGVTTINGGALSVGTLANGGSASDIGAAPNSAANLVLNGGTLQYTGSGATSDRLFTLGTAGGTIDNEGGQLTLNNPGAIALSGTGARTLTLTGSDTSGDTLAAVLGDKGGQTAITKNGTGTWILTGNNTNSGTVTINTGTLQVGNGGTSGSIGTGAVIDSSVLVWNRSDAVSFGGLISGAGSLVKTGAGTLTLMATNTYTGPTTVSNGTLVVVGSSVGGDMDVEGGTLVEGGVGVVGTMNVAGNLNIDSGTVVATLNKSLSPSNTVYSVAGTLEYSGGTLKLLNDGPQLVNGDTFAIFNRPFSGTTIVSPGFTVQNNGDGSFTVTSVAPPPTVTATLSSGQLNLSWPAVWTGLSVQAQTNSLATGLSTNWVTLPGTDASNSYSITPDISKQTVFYRLAP